MTNTRDKKLRQLIKKATGEVLRNFFEMFKERRTSSRHISKKYNNSKYNHGCYMSVV